MKTETATADKLLSDSDIVPEEYQYLLIYWADQFRRGYYDIGKIANEIIEITKIRKMNIPLDHIYRAVGRFCGKSGRTVKYYSEVASFFTAEVYEEYEMLPFSHFAFAMKMKDRWKEVLDYSKSVPYMTVEELEKKFLARKSDGSDLSIDEIDLSYIIENSNGKNAAVLPYVSADAGSSSADHASVSDVVYDEKSAIAIRSIKHIVSYLSNVLAMIDIESPARSNIERALSLLQEALDKFKNM